MENSIICRDVVSFNGVFADAYQANSLGEVWSKDRYIIYKNGAKHFHKGKKLLPALDKLGYQRVLLYNNGFYKNIYVQVVIADCFPDICGEKFLGADVDHLDGNPSNNRPENLKYKSHKDNCNNPITLKRRSEVMTNRKDLSKSVLQLAKDGTFIAEYTSVMEAERQTGIPHGNISKCCNGKRTYSGGFIWCFR